MIVLVDVLLETDSQPRQVKHQLWIVWRCHGLQLWNLLKKWTNKKRRTKTSVHDCFHYVTGFSLRKVSQCHVQFHASFHSGSVLSDCIYLVAPPQINISPVAKVFNDANKNTHVIFCARKWKKHFLVSERLNLQSLVSHKKWVYDVSASLLKYLWPNSLLSVCCVFPCFNPEQISMFFHVLKKTGAKAQFQQIFIVGITHSTKGDVTSTSGRISRGVTNSAWGSGVDNTPRTLYAHLPAMIINICDIIFKKT